jgi:hypothetical protein
MSKLTLGRMAKLYGLHRSTLYEAVDKGRVSAGFDGKGQRVVDLSEMIRVYGEPQGRPTPEPDSSTPLPDSSPTPAGWAEMAAELRLLREEVAGLRQELRLIGHEGVRPQVKAQPPMVDRPPVREHPPVGEVERPRAQSFADLLAGLE